MPPALIARVQEDLVSAMKARDELRLSVLRMMKTALKNKEIEKIRPLEEPEALQVLQTLVKQRHESVEQFTKGGRTDLADKETKEIAIIEGYLPAAPSDAELAQAIDAAIAETGAKSPKEMGAVIKAAKAHLVGKTVDGKALSDLVRDRLARMAGGR
ncbi:MAG: GatB/YqeY domain-containing protein [Acidobacteria bacterium]|nr:GatB/YqeY domain-containing protein [Acidobacteriota bacterium]